MKNLLLVLIILFFAGCGPDSSSSSDDPVDVPENGTYSITGYIQKGPFVSGSSITICELDAILEPTGDCYPTTTSDDLGTFSLGSTLTSQYVEIIATGYYFNEVSGFISSSMLTLRAIAKLSDSESCNVNLLTTLEQARLKSLILTGVEFETAREQAEQEILAIFQVEGVAGPFDSMNIVELGEQNKALMAVTAILQADNSVGELSEIISKISLDVKEDGTLDDADLITEITTNTQIIDAIAIKAHLEDRYGDLGVTVVIGSFEDYLDSDGDGILNKDDDNTPDTILFPSVTDSDLSTLYESTVTISGITGTIPIIGTAYHNGTIKTDFKAEEGDTIKLSLASSPNYSTAASISITIAGVEYSYTVTTKPDDRQQIIVFDSGQPAQDGDFGYANAQSWCNAEATNQGLTGTITPWLSNSAFDSGTDFAPFTPDAVNPRQVQSLTGGLIASKWTEFFNAEGTDTLQSLGVVDDGYWTGMVSGPSYDGRTTYNCDQWTRNGNIVNDLDYGNYNRHDIADRTTEGDPQGVNTTTCDQLKKILCIAY